MRPERSKRKLWPPLLITIVGLWAAKAQRLSSGGIQSILLEVEKFRFPGGQTVTINDFELLSFFLKIDPFSRMQA
jgi:hypothetical protein